jgi:hypothetical protein
MAIYRIKAIENEFQSKLLFYLVSQSSPILVQIHSRFELLKEKQTRAVTSNQPNIKKKFALHNIILHLKKEQNNSRFKKCLQSRDKGSPRYLGFLKWLFPVAIRAY